MIYDRNIVIDKIIDLKNRYNEGKTQRSEGYLSNKELAKICGVEVRTFTNYLSKEPDKNGKVYDFPFSAIIKLCNFFGCEVEYLLDKKMTCKTRTSTEIHDETGLSEEAINTLRNANKGYKKVIKENGYQIDQIGLEVIESLDERDMDNTFIELINHIIENYLDIGSRIIPDIPIQYILDVNRQSGDKAFPTNDIVSYISEIRLKNKSKKERIFELVDEIGKINSRSDFLYIYDKLISEGYDEQEIEKQILHYQISEKVDVISSMRYSRIDIQDIFSEFLKSDYILGANNGK